MTRFFPPLFFFPPPFFSFFFCPLVLPAQRANTICSYSYRFQRR